MSKTCSVDAKGVTSAADYETFNAELGRCPQQAVLCSEPLGKQAAAKAFYEFKDVVKAAQRCEQLRRGAGPLQGDPLKVAGRPAVGAHCPHNLVSQLAELACREHRLEKFLPEPTGTLLTEEVVHMSLEGSAPQNETSLTQHVEKLGRTRPIVCW